MKVLIYSIIASGGFLCSTYAPSSSIISVYEVRSLSMLNSAEVVDMEITLDEDGIASVSRTRVSAQATDQHRVHIATDMVGVTGSMPDHTAVHEFDSLPTGYKLYWIPIDGDVPSIVNGGKRLVVWCDGCEDCKPIIYQSGNAAVVRCNNSCCILKHKMVDVTNNLEGGGIYLVATDVQYMN